jgi:dienelactone hydrolase
MLPTLTLAALCALATPTGKTAQPLTAPVAGDAVSIQTQDRLEIGATYFAPRSSRGKAPGVLLIHDAGADQRQVQEIAGHLHKKGFGVLSIDLRGHGVSISEKAKWSALTDDTARQTMWTFAAKDLRAGAEFLRRQKSIHASNLSIVGVGAGCTLAVRHAMDDENTRAIVLISPDEENWGFNLESGVSDLEGLPTLIVAAKESRAQATALQSAGHNANNGDVYIQVAVMKSKETVLLEDARLRSQVADFLRKEVMPKKR